MAFRKNPAQNTVTLEFGDDSDFPGLTVVLRRMSVQAWIESMGLVEDGRLTVSNLLTGIQTMVPHLVSWDLEEADGSAVPVSAALDQDKDLLTVIYTAWLNGSTGVSAPLEQNSPDGPHSVRDVSLPMEPLSTSPES